MADCAWGRPRCARSGRLWRVIARRRAVREVRLDRRRRLAGAAGSAPTGLTLRFIEQGRFGIGIVLRNASGRRVTVVDVHTPEPAGGLISQVGTRLVRWTCNGHGCSRLAFLRSSFGAVRPAPLVVAPGKGIGIQLNYRLAACGAVPFASAAAAQSLEVDYRYGHEALQREALPLGSARLRVRMPGPSDCVRLSCSADRSEESVFSCVRDVAVHDQSEVRAGRPEKRS